ncbi:hypothetical protein DOY81_009205 [Sarcophaga bullata]|nr:hypothetical protein DOY81_009205 [Sarcophaga bullata]
MALRLVCISPAFNVMGQTFVRAMSTQGAGKNIGFPACDNLKAKGAKVYDKTAELALNSDFVITMLPNNDIVSKAYEDMTAQGVNKDTIFIDSSTIDPNLVKQLQK